MPRQRMENIEHLGGSMLDHLRSRLKQDPDGVLAKEEEVSEEFDPETLPVFLTRGSRVVGFVDQPADTLKASALLSTFLEKALLNDVGMVRVEEMRKEQKVVHKQPPPVLEFECANCGDWHEGRGDFHITTPNGRIIPFCTEECKRAWEDDAMEMEAPPEAIEPPPQQMPYYYITTQEFPPTIPPVPRDEPGWAGILRNMRQQR